MWLWQLLRVKNWKTKIHKKTHTHTRYFVLLGGSFSPFFSCFVIICTSSKIRIVCGFSSHETVISTSRRPAQPVSVLILQSYELVPATHIKFHLRAIKAGLCTLIFSTLKMSTCPHEQGEHIVEEFFVGRVVVRDVRMLFVLLATFRVAKFISNRTWAINRPLHQIIRH